jgi:hypothetical protein
MFLRHSEIVTTRAVAIGRIAVLRMHAAGIYVAPAVGEFFDCKCVRNQTEVFFLGQPDDTRRAHSMLATIRSAMDREFADFLESRGASCKPPRTLAASFAQGMGHRLAERLRRLKSRRTDGVLSRGAVLGGGAARLLRGLFDRAAPHSSSNAVIAHLAGVKAGGRVKLG